MKNKYFSALMLFVCLYLSGILLQAQTTIIGGATGNGNFEAATFAPWVTVNQSASLGWFSGAASVPANGTKAAYHSIDGGVTYNYNPAAASASHFYQDVSMPVLAGTDLVTLSFALKGIGESSWDRLLVYTAPTSVTPLAGSPASNATAITGATLVYTQPAAGSGTVYSNIVISLPNSLSGTTFRLIFTWQNDGSFGTSPGSSIDDVVVSFAPSMNFVSTAKGGLWSDGATWVGGIAPPPGNDATIVAGSTVTVNQIVNVRNLNVSGNLNLNNGTNTTNTINASGDFTINSTGKFYGYTSLAATANGVITVAGDFTNNGYADLANCSVTFNGSQVGGSLAQTLSGTGIFQGDGTKGIIRLLSFSTTGNSVINTTNNLCTANLVHTAGTLNTNGKLEISNTRGAQGLAYNTQVSTVAVTNMGTGYVAAPVAAATGVVKWPLGAATAMLANARYTTDTDVYIVTVAGTSLTTKPTHTAGTATNGGVTLLWIGTAGTIGNAFLGTATHVANTQYWFGNNLYTCVSGGVGSVAAPPIHTTANVSASGTATFRYVGTPCRLTANWDAVSANLRSFTVTQPGIGYQSGTAPLINIVAYNSLGTGAVALSVVRYAPTNFAASTFQKSGQATITGGLTINSSQGVANTDNASGVGLLYTSNGGGNYTVPPQVGINGPSGINLVTNPGSGYTAQPTIIVSGGTLVSGVALTTSNFTIAVVNSKVISVYLSTPGTACYSVPPTLTMSTGTATVAFPAGCWATATANLNTTTGQVSSFTVTNAGYGYVTTATAGVGTTSGTAAGGTFSTVATAPLCLVGAYGLTVNYFTPATAAVVNVQGAEFPANGKLQNLTLAGNGAGLNLTSNISLYGATPFSNAASSNASVINLGGFNLKTTWNGYAGAAGSNGLTPNYIKNGSMTLTGRGGPGTYNFPFSGTFTWFAGMQGALYTTGCTAHRITVTQLGAPTDITGGSGSSLGNRTYRVKTEEFINGLLAPSANTGSTVPYVTMNFDYFDGLTCNQNLLYVSQAAAQSGPWTLRNNAPYSASATVLPTVGVLQTSTAGPNGPVVYTGDDYFAWSRPAPLITSFTPATVCGNSGSVVITGTGFLGASAVSIGGTPVLSYTVNSNTQITANVGNVTSGIIVVTVDGLSASSATAITVSPSVPAPTVTYITTPVNPGDAYSLNLSSSSANIEYFNQELGGTSLATYSGTDTYAGLPGSSCVDDTLWFASNDGTCLSSRTPFIVIIPSVVLTATPLNSLICTADGSVALNATNLPGMTYAWSPSTGLSSTTSFSTVASPTTTTAYTLNATNANGCSLNLAVNVGVLLASSVTPTATPANGCYPATTSVQLNSNLVPSGFGVGAITYSPAVPTTYTPLVTSGDVTAGNGTALSGGTLDDGGWANIPLGFNYNFFGTVFNNVAVGTNGLLMFGSVPGYGVGAGQLGQYTFVGPTAFPNVSNPGNVIAACAMDLHCGYALPAGNTVRYWTDGIAPTRRFILEYKNVSQWNSTAGANLINAQIMLYETTGIVEIHMASANSLSAKTIGLQDGTRTVGATAPGRSASTVAVTVPEAWRFQPPAAFTYAWTPATALSATNITNPVLTISGVGTQTRSVIVTNPITGCATPAKSVTVVITASPTPPTISGNTQLCENGSTILTASAPSGSNTIQWYSDSEGLNLINEGQVFSISNIQGDSTLYVAELGGCRSALTPINLTVSPASIGGIITTPNDIVCAGTNSVTLTLSGYTGSITKWQSSPSSSFANSISDINNTSNTLTLTNQTTSLFYRAVVTSGNCLSAYSSIKSISVLTINAITLSSASGTNNQNLCVNNPISPITYSTTGATGATFSGLPTGVSGVWAANVVTISGTPTIQGSYSFTVTLNGGCGNVSATGSINVGLTNSASLTSAVGTNAQTVCINSPIVNITYYSANSTGISFSGLPAGLTVAWASNVATISGTPSTVGTFNYTITLTSSCNPLNLTGSITVIPNSSITLSSAAGTNAQTKCNNSQITNITYATVGASGATFSGFPSGVTGAWAANVVTISGTPTVSGTFNYTVTLTGACGSTITALGTITVSPSPIAKAGTAFTKSCTSNTSGAIIGSAVTAGETYSWSPATGLSSATVSNPTANPTATSTYTVTTTNTASGCSAMASVIVTVNTTVPVANAGAAFTKTCTSNMSGAVIGVAAVAGTTYAWSPATGLSSATVSNPTANPTATTTYTLTATNTASGCTATSSVIVTVNTTSPVANAGTAFTKTCSSNASGAVIGVAAVAGTTYAWSPAAGLSSATVSNPTANPTATTTYTLTATNTASGCTSTSSVIVTVNTSVPVANAGTAFSKTCTSNSSGAVIGVASVAGTTYAWSPATGLSSATVSNPTANPTATTTYTLTSTNTASGCTATSSVIVTVNTSVPVANAGTAFTKTCTANTSGAVIGVASVAGTTYAWSPATGLSSATVSNPTANPTATTTYTLTATNTASACSATSSVIVTVDNSLTATITASGSTTLCTGGAVVLNANTGTGYIYQWKLNGTNISGATAASYSASAAGSYTVTITNGTCSGTSSETVVSISAGITASITNTTPLTFCAGSNVLLNANTGTGFTYQWKLNGLDIAGATAASYTASASGSYTVTVSLSGECASTSTAKVVTVNPLPTVSSTITPASGNTCTGGSATLSGTGAVNYVWTGGVTNNVSFVPTASSTYTVTGTDANGCVNTATRSITVNAIPTTPGTITGPTMICGLTTATYSITAVAGATSYTWTLPTGITGTSTTNSITVAINTSLFTTGNIGVQANSTYCTSALKTLAIAKIPAAPSTLTGTTVTCGITSATYTASASTGATSYTWALPTGFTGSSTTTTLLASINNTLFTTGNVSVIANNSCGSSTAKTLAVSKVPFTPGTISGSTITCGLTTATYSITAVTGATSYSWTLPTGITGTSITNSIVVSINNTLFTGGNISVIANNACGSSPAKTLAVSKFLATPGTISGPSLICGLTTGTYSVAAITGATSYTWTLPAGLTGTSSTNSITASINPALFTSGNVTVTANNACGASPVKTLALSKIPASPTTLSGTSFICGLTSTTYTATAVTGATSYTWSLPSGLTGTSTTNTITVAVNPALFVSGSIGITANNACGSSAIKTLTLTKIPSTPTAISGLAAGVCAGSTQTYSCTAMANTSSYTWTVPAGSLINSGQGTASISVTFPTPFTSGTISVTANSACGSSAAKTLSILSNPSTPGAITGQSSNICGGGIFSYSITAVSGATGYNWLVPAGCSIASGANTTAITMSVPSSFAGGNISVSSSNTCGAGTASTLALIAVPSTFATITGPASACANQAGLVFNTTPVYGSSQFAWTVPSGAIITSGQGTANITVTWGAAAGSVSVVAFNACGSGLSKTKSLTLATCRLGDEISLDEIVTDNTWSLFPNPTSDKVNIHFTEFDSSKKYALTVTNALGQLVYNSSINQQTTIIELQSFAKPGMYFVHLINEQNNVMETKKLIVQ